MLIKDIPRYFPRVKIDEYSLSILYRELGFSDYELDTEKIDLSKFKVYEIYDFPHKSDESSYRWYLTFDDEDGIILGHSGDKTDPEVKFSNSILPEKIYKYLDQFRIKDDFEDSISTFSLDDEVVSLSDQYTNLYFQDGHLYAVLSSPKWSLINLKHCVIFSVDDLNNIYPIKFVRFKDDFPAWKDNDITSYIIATNQEGEEIEVPYYRILIKINN